MFVATAFSIMLSGAAVNPSDLGRCVQNQAIKLASSPQPSEKLATMALARCKDILDELVIERNSAAAKQGETAAARPENSQAYRLGVSKTMTKMANDTIKTIRERSRK
jgi:hypothetical protein